jgi:hypothetical protein
VTSAGLVRKGGSQKNVLNSSNTVKDSEYGILPVKSLAVGFLLFRYKSEENQLFRVFCCQPKNVSLTSEDGQADSTDY